METERPARTARQHWDLGVLEPCLEVLLGLWRAAPDPAVARAIERVGERLRPARKSWDAPAFTAFGLSEVLAWLGEQPVPTAEVEEVVDRLPEFVPDPRLTPALEPLMHRWVNHALADRLRALVEQNRVGLGTELPPIDLEDLAHIVERDDERRNSDARLHRAREQLFDEVRAAPLDETAMRVGADRLMSIGDSLGEWLILHLSDRSDDESQATVARLWHLHWRSWVTGLLGPNEYERATVERGLPVHVECNCMPRLNGAWLRVDSLEVHLAAEAGYDWSPWSPLLRQLRRLHLAVPEDAAALLGVAPAASLERLIVTEMPRAGGAPLVGLLDRLPALQQLQVSGSVEDVRSYVRAPALRHLSVSGERFRLELTRSGRRFTCHVHMHRRFRRQLNRTIEGVRSSLAGTMPPIEVVDA